MKNRLILGFVILGLLLASAAASTSAVLAQNESGNLTLKLSKDFGFNDFDGSIEGKFSLHVAANADLQTVVFYANDKVVAQVTDPPLTWQFNTSQFAPGFITFQASGVTRDGQRLSSNIIKANILSAEESRQRTSHIIIPLVGGILLLVFIPLVVISLLSIIKEKSRQGSAAIDRTIFGGAVCPHCKAPFARHWWGLNFITVKLDRCPHCGKWAFVPKASLQALQAAEKMIHDQGKQGNFCPAQNNDLDKAIEDSRYYHV